MPGSAGSSTVTVATSAGWIPRPEGNRYRGADEIRLREGAESLAAGDGESPAGAAQAFAGRGGVGLLDAL